MIKVDNRSAYKGNLKHFSLTTIPDQKKIIMTGGVSIATCTPMSSAFVFTEKNMAKGVAEGLKNMNNKRYGHCSAFIRDRVLVLGGFAHQDIAENPP